MSKFFPESDDRTQSFSDSKNEPPLKSSPSSPEEPISLPDPAVQTDRFPEKNSSRFAKIFAILFFLFGFSIGFQNCGKVDISGSVASTVAASSGTAVSCSAQNITACTYGFAPGSWGSCSTACGSGTQTQGQNCVRSDGTVVPPSQCPQSSATPVTQSCSDYSACTYGWTPGSYGACSNTCGAGTQTQGQTCTRSDGTPATSPSQCPPTPPNTQNCSDYSGCAALNCSATFSPASVSVSNATSQASTTLVINAPTGTSGTYNCVTSPAVAGVAPVTGTFQGSTANIVLSFGYPTACTVTTVRPDNTTASCTANLNVTCSAQVQQSLYNATVKQFPGVTQSAIAQACVDGSFPTQASLLNFPSTDTGMFSKWQINCATRYCYQPSVTNDAGAMGFITQANMTFVAGGSALDPNAAVTVNCQYDSTQTIPQSQNVCQIDVNRTAALQSFTFNYPPATSNPCGNTFSAVQSAIATDPNNPNLNGDITCGTAYCQSLGQGFQAGALTDFNTVEFIIRCTKATGLYPAGI